MPGLLGSAQLSYVSVAGDQSQSQHVHDQASAGDQTGPLLEGALQELARLTIKVRGEWWRPVVMR